MRVVTLDDKQFAAHCARLAQLTEGDGAFDTVVGIVTGGEYVARAMAQHMDTANVVTVCRQRPSTRRKGGMFRRVVKCLPRRILDLLRIVESRILAGRRHTPGPDMPVVIPTDIDDAKRILVVDDAIDSGHTMQAVVNAIAARCPEAQIHTAVITVTTPHPSFRPDYTLYDDGTLIRFPWSADFKR